MYKIIKNKDIPKKDKLGIHLDLYPSIGNCELDVVETETGHNQEFYNKKSSFNYVVLEGTGSFFLDDREIVVEKGDFIQISPGTRIYYKGKMKLALVVNPPWREEDEIETKPSIW